MGTGEVKKTKKRRMWLAALFSLFVPGLGQIYCGRPRRGVLLYTLNILPIPLIITLSYISTLAGMTALFFYLLIASGIVSLWSMGDSVMLARGIGASYRLKKYNSVSVYILLLFVLGGTRIGGCFIMRAYSLESFVVPTCGEYPNILPGDRFLSNKRAYARTDPERGDSIVFVSPKSKDSVFVERVVAVAGDTVEVIDGELYINSKKLQLNVLPQDVLDNIRIDYRMKPLDGQVFEEVNGDAKYKIFLANVPRIVRYQDCNKLTVPDRHCFVLGDNRNMSYDSRHFGPIHLDTVRGRADFIYLPVLDRYRLGFIE